MLIFYFFCNETVQIRSRRDISGIFDSIANGAGEFAVGMKKVGDSVMAAFNGIFSTTNKNAITDGFSKLGKSLKEGFNSFFGQNGEVTKGFKKVGNKIKEAFNGDGSSSSSTSDSDPSPSKDAPSGEVPAEETT